MSLRWALLWALLSLSQRAASAVPPPASDDDFGFDLSEELAVDISELPAPAKLEGIPDVTATVGKLLEFTVPGNAFTGNVVKYEVKSPLPNWLAFIATTNTFTGIPLSSDKTDFLVSVIARGNQEEDTAFDVFRVHVQKQPAKARFSFKQQCSKNPLVLTIYVDQKLETIKANKRRIAVKNLAGFLGLNISAFTLGAQKLFSDTTDSSVILAGPGNIKKHTSKQPTNIDLLVGCENKLWEKYISLVHQLKEQAQDGTLSEVLGLPVLGWRVQQQPTTLQRGRRETYDEYNEYDLDYEDIYEDDDEGEITTIIPKVSEVTTSTTTAKPTTIEDDTENHPHRHHHGEIPNIHEEISPDVLYTDDDDETTISATVTTVPTTTPRASTIKEIQETTIPASSTSYDEDYDEDYDYDGITEVPTLATEPTITKTTAYNTTMSRTTLEDIVPAETTYEDTTTTEKPTTQMTTKEDMETTMEETTPTTTTTEAATTTTEPTTIPTTPSTTTTVRTTTVPTTTTEPTTISTTTTTTTTTTTEQPTTTTSTTTTTMRTTESIEYGFKNFPPQINHRLKKVQITAGTVLSYIIPENTFQDIEDGSNLQLKFIDPSQKQNQWIQFNEHTAEIYGLPLEEHVSKYDFLIQATDKEGASVSDKLEVSVQQHKGVRTVTHEFKLHLRVEKKSEFPNSVDWQLRTLRGLATLFHNKDLTQIVVRNIDYNTDFVTFSWTNDTLPKSYCPKTELDYLLSVMTANDEGDPSYALSQVLAPELRVKHVEYRGIGQCEEKPELPIAPPKASPTNFSPIPRNQVDHINATAGELLIFKVPDDTFYDPEDGNARNLKMSLLTMDRRPLPKDHWLQFDVKNQEFYGVPLNSDIGRSEYQLVCEDRGGLTANDGLVVAVNPSPRIQYNVAFSMTLDTPYELFLNSASIKRKFVEKLQELFRDRDTNNIHINSITEGSTVVSWNNKSLPTDRCPDAEIKRLRRVLVNDDETLPDRIYNIMDPEFPVKSISLTPTGICQGETTIVHSPDIVFPIDESSPAETSDEYLITFVVPAVIIASMLLLAGVVACVLYRRRRTGKMNVEEDERQSFRNKGIPVIFQDEIDEKPDSGTKAPIILKEEKPPLAPPEYSKGGTPINHDENEDAPYQPPPPFTPNQDNGRQPRPKPTPTYRKPPPYVPP